MSLSNTKLAELFADIANRCDIKGDENPFAVRAYKTVSDVIAGHGEAIAEVWKAGGIDALIAIKGIGKEIAKKIDELMRTGKLEFYERLRAAVPDGVADMTRVPGFGPKRVKLVWDERGIDSIAKLEATARAGQLRDLPKFGEKLEQKILEGITSLARISTGRTPMGSAWVVATNMIAALQKLKQVKRIEYAGSLRRGRDTIGDVDLIAACSDAKPVMEAFVGLPGVREVLGHGPTKSSVRLDDGLQVDLRAVEPAVWGTAMQYFTGSQQHNIRLRELAQKQGWSLNEYALTGEGKHAGKSHAFSDEAALYAFLGVQYVPPELREDRGEFEREIPSDLVALPHMRGDLQMHSTWSDGALPVMEMARVCIGLGYEYMLTTDHTQGLGMVNGLTPERVKAQRKEVDAINAQLKREGIAFTVLHGVEVEVKSDGTLDLPDEVLAACDLVQASVHTSLNQPREQITARAMRAINNPHVDILGHPAGRIINEREGADYDWDALFAAAAGAGVAVEINAAPKRLDLSDVLARRAAEKGCLFTISTDAHDARMLANMHFGVTVARRAWLRKGQVLNTRSLKDLLAWARARGR